MKKGFTMIELLAVFTVAAIILLIAFPQVTSLLKKSDNDEYETYKKNIYIACEAYIEDQNIVINGVRTIYLYELVNSGFLKANLVNPKNNRSVTESPNTNQTIKVTKDEDNVIQFELQG